MKLSKTVPPGPRVVPLEEYQAHGLSVPPSLAIAHFFEFFMTAADSLRPTVWIEESPGCSPQRVHAEDVEREIARMKKENRKATPRVVPDPQHAPDAYNFRNFNRSPLPLVPKPAPLGLPKIAPPAIPSDCEEATLAGILAGLVTRGLVLSDGSAKALAKATAKERRLFSRVECVTVTDTITEQDNCGAWIVTESAPYVVKTLEVFTEAGRYCFPLTDKAPAPL